MKLDRRAGCARIEQLSLPTGSACAGPEAASNGGLQVMWQGCGAWPVQWLAHWDVQAFALYLNQSLCALGMYQYMHRCVPPPPQARLINHAVSVRSALSGAQAASQLSGKVTAAKPNWAKLTTAGSSENMETCLTPTMYFRYPLRMQCPLRKPVCCK